MAGSGTAAATKNTRTGCGCLVALIVVVIIIVAASSGGSKSNGGSSSGGSGAQGEARAYIKDKARTINFGRVDYEHIAALVALLQGAGSESSQVINEIAKVAQESHDEIDGFRAELFKTGGDEKLSEATFELSDGANELKNAMGALVGYTGNPNPATLAQFTIQLEKAKAKWNLGVDQIWTIAGEHGAYRLKSG